MTFDLAYLVEIAPQILRAAGVTVAATFGGMALALVLGLVLAIAKRSPARWVRWPVAVAVDVVRTTPLLVQLYLLFYVLPYYGVTLGPFTVGLVGLGLHYASYIAEVYRAGIEAVPAGQWEACIALSLTRRQTWIRVILPQAVPTVIPPLGNYLISMFKATPYLATITVHEMLGEALFQASFSFRYLEPIVLVGLVFLAVSLPSAILVRRLEKRRGSVKV
jgi:polar amino acid transport system permease protein